VSNQRHGNKKEFVNKMLNGNKVVNVNNDAVGNKMLNVNKKERRKNRLCPEEGCKWTSTLFQLIAHLNNDHKFTLPVIGRLIVPIRDDKRMIPNPILKIRRSIKNYKK